MALSKIQSESVDLADDFAFSGDVTGAGKVVQVQRAVVNNPSSTQTASNSYIPVNSTPTCTITPKFANSIIIVQCSGPIAHFNAGSGSGNYGPIYNIGRSVAGGAYAMVDTTGPLWGFYKATQTVSHWEDLVANYSWPDLPSYTVGQSIAYKMYGRKTTNSLNTWLNHHGGIGSVGGGSTSLYVIATEIAQ
jgi:hypothetical protein